MPDPTLTLVTTTAALPREAEGLGGGELERLRLEVADLSRTISWLDGSNAKLFAENGRLRAELVSRGTANDLYRDTLAKRDSAIGEWLKANDQWAADNDRLRAEGFARGQMVEELEAKVRNLRANLDEADRERALLRLERDIALAELAKRDETIAVLRSESRELAKLKIYHRELRAVHADLQGSLASLRAQLARAGAIEEKAKAAIRQSRHASPYDTGWTLTPNNQMDDLEAALAKPSPVLDASGSLDGNHTHGEFVGWSDGQRGGAAEGERRKPSCPCCGSLSIKRCDSEHAICKDCDLLFRALGLPPEAHT